MVILDLILTGLVLFVAGDLLLRLLRVPVSPDPVARVGIATAIGLSVIALLIEFSTWIRWTPASVRMFVFCLAIAWLALTRRLPRIRIARAKPCRWYLLPVLLLVLVASLAILQVRGVAVAPGVDSAHHLMLTRLIVDHGRLPASLDPYIPEGRLAYRWGIHANVAFSSLLLGQLGPFEVSRMIVLYAALLRIVGTLSMYAAARSLFADRLAGLIAGAVTAGFSALPAALVNQGRFTHLAGVAVLAALIAVPFRARRVPSQATVVAILLAGLFLIHVRVAVFGCLWVAAVTGFSIRSRREAAVWGTISVIVAALLILPQVMRLTADPLVHSMVEGSGYAQDQNRWTQRYVPAKMAWLPHNGLLLSGATAGLTGIAGLGVSAAGRLLSVVWTFVVGFVSIRLMVLRRRKRPPARRGSRRKSSIRSPIRTGPWRSVALLAVWVAASLFVLFFRAFGIDLTNVVPFAAALLTAFIPVILLLSGIAGRVFAVLAPESRGMIAMILLASCAGFGIAQRKDYQVQSPFPSPTSGR